MPVTRAYWPGTARGDLVLASGHAQVGNDPNCGPMLPIDEFGANAPVKIPAGQPGGLGGYHTWLFQGGSLRQHYGGPGNTPGPSPSFNDFATMSCVVEEGYAFNDYMGLFFVPTVYNGWGPPYYNGFLKLPSPSVPSRWTASFATGSGGGTQTHTDATDILNPTFRIKGSQTGNKRTKTLLWQSTDGVNQYVGMCYAGPDKVVHSAGMITTPLVDPGPIRWGNGWAQIGGFGPGNFPGGTNAIGHMLIEHSVWAEADAIAALTAYLALEPPRRRFPVRGTEGFMPDFQQVVDTSGGGTQSHTLNNLGSGGGPLSVYRTTAAFQYDYNQDGPIGKMIHNPYSGSGGYVTVFGAANFEPAVHLSIYIRGTWEYSFANYGLLISKGNSPHNQWAAATVPWQVYTDTSGSVGFYQHTAGGYVNIIRETGAQLYLPWGIQTSFAAAITEGGAIHVWLGTFPIILETAVAGITDYAGHGEWGVDCQDNSGSPALNHIGDRYDARVMDELLTIADIEAMLTEAELTVTSSSPPSGLPGVTVDLYGTGFMNGCLVEFGGVDSPSVTVLSDTHLQAVAPSHAAGLVNIVVTNPDTQSFTWLNSFTFLTVAETLVLVTPGDGFVDLTYSGAMDFASVVLSGFTFTGSPAITAIATERISPRQIRVSTTRQRRGASYTAHVASGAFLDAMERDPGAQSGAFTGFAGAPAFVASVLPPSLDNPATQIRLQFNVDMNQTTLANPANYAINNGATIQSATVESARSVLLTTSALSPDVDYTVTTS